MCLYEYEYMSCIFIELGEQKVEVKDSCGSHDLGPGNRNLFFYYMNKHCNHCTN